MLTIRETEQRIGVHPSTLRRWEQAGLLTPRRTPGGHRRFSDAEVKRLLSRPQEGVIRSARREECCLEFTALLRDALAPNWNWASSQVARPCLPSTWLWNPRRRTGRP